MDDYDKNQFSQYVDNYLSHAGDINNQNMGVVAKNVRVVARNMRVVTKKCV